MPSRSSTKGTVEQAFRAINSQFARPADPDLGPTPEDLIADAGNLTLDRLSSLLIDLFIRPKSIPTK